MAIALSLGAISMLGVDSQPGFIPLLMAINGSPKCQCQAAKWSAETTDDYSTSKSEVTKSNLGTTAELSLFTKGFNN